MIAIDGEFAIFDSGYSEHSGFTFIILKFDLGPYVPEFRRNIVDVIDEGQFRLMFTETLFRAQFNADFIA